ncbi:coiled-coil domain-containing protein 134 [Exaiptasia diaphana]|uniref:Uncharacterized protein n=1 Tax=Exaiptasia diaphana TaxID=2652724 RepID=A0A913XX81_EXADI|nr:coiled-coil domain-containing protein 134 [Exaiptasia diaphana]KXJ23947.1 Coiled-coil domain-containing protein 134 [Exaiptasia diaphana]
MERAVFRVLVVFLAVVSFTLGNEELDKQAEELKEQHKDLRAARSKLEMETYRSAFKRKRGQQIAAAKTIQNDLKSYAKQFDMVDKVTEKMFWVMEKSRTELANVGYTPGDPFPLEKDIKEALAHVLENTALFGDILLRLPDITHQILRRSKEHELLIKWCISICNATEVYDGTGRQLLNLVAQELQLVPKDDNYVNPYKLEAQLDAEYEKEKARRTMSSKQKKKEEKKKRKKGPRLSDEL